MPRKHALVLGAVALALTTVWMRAPEEGVAPMIDPVAAREPLGMRFEPNLGQSAVAYDFSARTAGYGLFLNNREAVVTLATVEVPSAARHGAPIVPRVTDARAIRLRWVDANRSAQGTAHDRLGSSANYLRGSDRDGWVRDVPQFGRVEYRDVYPGIDLRYYAAGNELEYDFVLAPGADPEAIRIGIEGTDELRIAPDGSLVMSAGDHELMQTLPAIYQTDLEGRRELVGGEFVLSGPDEVGFRLDAFDRSRTLVIDPKLGSSTYAGGESTDSGEEVAHDGSGNVYVAGWACSADFPATDGTFQGVCDAFVSRYNKKGKLDVSTLFGGAASDTARTIDYRDEVAGTLRAGPFVSIAGITASSDFPTVNPIQEPRGDTGDMFVMVLDADLTTVHFSTAIGGSGQEFPNDIVMDADSTIAVTGSTTSKDFPTEDPTQKKLSGVGDAVMFLLDPGLGLARSATPEILKSTFHGGTGDESGYGLTLSPGGIVRGVVNDCIEVTGITTSTKKFPTEAALQKNHGGGDFDIFLAKWCGLGSPDMQLAYSSYYGGDGDDFAHDMVADSAGRNLLAIETCSTDIALSNPLQDTLNGTCDAMLAVFDVTGLARHGSSRADASLFFATYLGGSEFDWFNGVGVSHTDIAYLAGGSNSADLSTVKPLAGYQGFTDVLLAQIDYGADARVGGRAPSFLFVSHFGGDDTDTANGITVDRTLKAYVTGFTLSEDFKVKKAVQKKNGGGFDAFYLVLKK